MFQTIEQTLITDFRKISQKTQKQSTKNSCIEMQQILLLISNKAEIPVQKIMPASIRFTRVKIKLGDRFRMEFGISHVGLPKIKDSWALSTYKLPSGPKIFHALNRSPKNFVEYVSHHVNISLV